MQSGRALLQKGQYQADWVHDAADLQAAFVLRGICFGRNGPDEDGFDQHCRHVLIKDTSTGQAVGCFRLMLAANGTGLKHSYSAQFYDLAAFSEFEGPLAEVGRFCIHPNRSDPDILRVAWGALTAIVDEQGVEMLFGCSSFAGTDVSDYLDAFALLKERHLAPDCWLPGIKAPEVFEFTAKLRTRPDAKRAALVMPPLLRTYLMMGGWVSDHAVVDRHMNTLHVFTGLEISAIPAARKRLLRAVAG